MDLERGVNVVVKERTANMDERYRVFPLNIRDHHCLLKGNAVY